MKPDQINLSSFFIYNPKYGFKEGHVRKFYFFKVNAEN